MDKAVPSVDRGRLLKYSALWISGLFCQWDMENILPWQGQSCIIISRYDFLAEINKIRKNAKGFKTLIESKCKLLDDKIDKIEVNEELCEDMCEQIVRLRESISFPVRSKEMSLIKLEVSKNYLTDYLDDPKRPSQIKLNKCCKSCLALYNPFSPSEPSQ